MTRPGRLLAVVLMATSGVQPVLAQTAVRPAATAAPAPAKPAAAKPAAKKPVPKGAYRKVNTPVAPPVAVATPEPPAPPPPPLETVAEAAPAAAEPAAKTGMFGSMKRKFNAATGRDAAAASAPLSPEAKSAEAQAAAGAWSPPVNMKGVSPAKYRQDTLDCEQYANGRGDTHAGNAATHSALKVGGITAAVMGVAVVATGGIAAIPFMATGIGMGAGAGAGIGALTGGVGAQKKFQTVVNSCMAGRGYTIEEN